MIKRTLTAVVYVALIVGFFCLRQFVDYRLFNVLTYVFGVIGTFEMVRAINDKLTFFTKCVVWAYALSLMPLMTFFENVRQPVTFAAAFAVVAALVFEFKTVTIENVGCALLALFYPTGLISVMIGINAMGDAGFIALLLVFVISSFADSGAYIIGSIVRGKQLSPLISPKKTISGFIGGLIGGALGAFLVWLVFPAAKGVFVAAAWEWVIYIVVGIVAAAVSVFGDLVEGAIKRKVGIKDMGNIMPGHGGVLDRVDAMMYVAVLTYFVFAAMTVLH